MSVPFRVPTNAGALLTLAHGRYELVLAPECGARLVAFRCDGRDLLRPASAEVNTKSPARIALLMGTSGWEG